MSMNAGTAVAYLELDASKYVKGLSTAREQLATFADSSQSAGDRIQALGGAMTGVGSVLTKTVTTPILGIGIAAAKVGIDFQSEMSRVQAISGATGSDLEALKEQAKELGATTSFSAKFCGTLLRN